MPPLWPRRESWRSRLDRFHQGLAESGQQPCKGNRPAVFWSRDTVHPDPELAGGGKRNPHKLDFEVFIAVIILDRNSRVYFHKLMLTGRVVKTNRARRRARSAA